MAFISPPPALFRCAKRESRTSPLKRYRMATSYLSPNLFNVSFESSSMKGNFGAIFMGEYVDPALETNKPFDVVVKCPINSDIGRELYRMEKYTNLKLSKSFNEEKRFPEYVGELIIPGHFPVATGISRLGLVWRKVGNGETLEDFLTSSRISSLISVLGARYSTPPIRRGLAAALLMELSLIVSDLQSCGIVHRDIKPENILVVPGDPAGTPLKAIDFGSSCDWKSPFKKGLRTATCDPIYTAPERRLDLFRPAYRFDVYSVGLIVLRCAVPSLTEASALSNFVSEVLSKCGFSFTRACLAVIHGRLPASDTLRQELQAFSTPENEDLYAVLATMLTKDPSSRADVGDCLRSRLLRSAFV